MNEQGSYAEAPDFQLLRYDISANVAIITLDRSETLNALNAELLLELSLAFELAEADLNVRCDMFDRLPTPYGLVRGGVAPDHQKIKTVTRVYDKTAANENFRFFGNVKLGRDITVEDLQAHYDQIVYAVGNESSPLSRS